MTELPKLTREALKTLRFHKSTTAWKFSISGHRKPKKPITLRLPPEKR